MLNWINEQSTIMIDLVTNWASHNTHTKNTMGLRHLETALTAAFSNLGGHIETIPFSHPTFEIGRAIKITKRPKAPIQLLLSGHYDTVFPATHPFQRVSCQGNLLKGPGVLDMKGGLVIMLKALEAFEKFYATPTIGWTVLITPDEEIGSPCSKELIIHHAKLADIGLVFEPCLPNGNLVSSRKGSASFECVVTGKAAHVGRDFKKGKNAITALSDWIYYINNLQKPRDLTLNIGTIYGGQAINVVPDFATCQLNIRAEKKATMTEWMTILKDTAKAKSKSGIQIKLSPLSYRPPKPFNKPTQTLFYQLRSCASQLGFDINWQKTGGVCDGNLIADCGIPTIDTLGAEGEGLHTDQEYILIESLVRRTQLTATFLRSLA